MTSEPRIIAASESPYSRHPSAGTSTESLLVDAFVRVLEVAGLDHDSVDGLGVSSFTLAPDGVADLAWRLAVRAHWLMDDRLGGASGLNMLQHALRAISAGDARCIVLLAGDHFGDGDFKRLVEGYNRATADYLAPIPTGGPNAVFAHLTQRHMDKYELTREDYGKLVIEQRAWAARNPDAVYRQPLSMEEYLAAPVVAAPLHRYDCVPVVSGANALLVCEADAGVRVRAIRALHNHDNQEGDGLTTGIGEFSSELWDEAQLSPGDMDAAYVYDDYPAMALVQLADLGFIPDGDVRRFLNELPETLRLNTSGGQLSAGQAGAAGGMHGLVEAVRQLLGMAGSRGIDAHRVVVSGYGMVLYRYGACANAAVLDTP